MGSIIRFGKRVEKSAENPHGWKELYNYQTGKKENIDFLNAPSVICLPGDGITYDDEMNGCCKIIELMLKQSGVSAKKMPNIYTFGFDTDTQFHRQTVFANNNQLIYGKERKQTTKPYDIEKYWQPFFDDYFTPILENKDGTFKTPAEIKKNFQNITFVSHCHGGIFAFQLEQFLTQKITEHYPDKVKEIMERIRMLHFASRRPIHQQGIYAKHFHVISQQDEKYADDFLSYDNLHKAIHRNPISEKSVLLPISKNEEILVMRELTADKDDEDHSLFLNYFSNTVRIPPALHDGKNEVDFVQQLLNRFVLHSDSDDNLMDIVAQSSPTFVSQKRKSGKELLSKIHQQTHKDRSLLSFLAQNTVSKYETDSAYLLQPDEQGKILYERKIEQYQKDGNHCPLIVLIRSIGKNLSKEIIANGINMALDRKDFILANAYARTTNVKLPVAQFEKSLRQIYAENLPHILPLLKKLNFQKNNEPLHQFMTQQCAKIKNSAAKLKVQTCLTSIANDISRKKRTLQCIRIKGQQSI